MRLRAKDGISDKAAYIRIPQGHESRYTTAKLNLNLVNDLAVWKANENNRNGNKWA